MNCEACNGTLGATHTCDRSGLALAEPAYAAGVEPPRERPTFDVTLAFAFTGELHELDQALAFVSDLALDNGARRIAVTVAERG